MERLILPVRTRADVAAVHAALNAMLGGHTPLRPVQVVLEDASVFGESVTWGGYPDEPPLDIELDGQGVTLRRTTMQLAGARVSVRNLRLDAGERKGIMLRILASEAIDLEDVRLSGSVEHDTGRGKQVLVAAGWFQATGPAVRVTATNVHVLDARGSAAITFSSPGDSAFSDVRWIDGRFGGCVGPELVLARVGTFAAPGTVRLGTGPFLRSQPQTVVLDGGEERAPDAALLERWRAE